jgi:hypothetical protein
MQPVKIKDQNADFAKPKDWDDRNGLCRSLPIRREIVEDAGGRPFFSLRSNWKPGADELAVLNAGGVVELECVNIQPAVSMSVVPCADSEAEPIYPILTEQYLRSVFAEELMRFGNHASDVLAQSVRSGTDNSNGGGAAIRALKRVVGLV